MIPFQVLTFLIAGVCFGGAFWAIFLKRDVFHPFAYILPMMFFLYAYTPIDLGTSALVERTPFSPNDWTLVQSYNLACVIAFLLGGIKGSLQSITPKAMRPLNRSALSRIRVFAFFLGGLGLLAFAYNVNNVGGLFEAYSRQKGGGASDSGYTSDAAFWTLSAIALLSLYMARTKVRAGIRIPILIFAAPTLIHGFFGARRGPTFVIVATLVVSWYLARAKRPPLWVFASGAGALGLLLLLIVSFRSEFRLGGSITENPTEAIAEMVEKLGEVRQSSVDRILGGNEFVYGSNVILSFRHRGDIFWGKRLFTILFVRPIPKQFWPTKYSDVGMERYLVNAGLGAGGENLMWASLGAAPGIFADSFAEFSWGGIVIAGLIGWGYCRVWRSAVTHPSLGMVVYVLMFAFSIFLVLQTLEAIVYRLAFCGIPVLAFWTIAIKPLNRPLRIPLRHRTNVRQPTLPPTGSSPDPG